MDELILTKRKLPHYYLPQRTYFVTYRIKGTFVNYNISNNFAAFLAIDETEDKKKSGNSLLLEKEPNNIVCDSLKYYDKTEYNLLCYCVMPNHVHVVFTLLENARILSKILQSIKRHSATEINKVTMQTGSIWQPESYDHIIRNENELLNTLNYVINNPVKAGLIEDWKLWKSTYLSDNIPKIIR